MLPLSDVLSFLGGSVRKERPLFILAAMTPLISGCAIATAYSEGNAPGLGGSAEIIVAITEAALGPDQKARAEFWKGVRKIEAILADQPGLLGYSLRRELLGHRVWTMTAWASEVDLRRFAASEAHREAARLGIAALTEFRTARIRRGRNASTISWDEALEALKQKRIIVD